MVTLNYKTSTNLMLAANIALSASGLAVGAYNVLSRPTHYYEAHAVTHDGNSYHVGDGADCAEAFRNGPMPADWKHLICKVVQE